MKRQGAMATVLAVLALVALARLPAWSPAASGNDFTANLIALTRATADGRLGQLLAADASNQRLLQQLEEAQEELLALADINAVLQQEYRWTQQENQGFRQIAAIDGQTLPGADCCADTELVLHFRSNSAAVERHYRAELAALVRSVQQIPGAVIEMSGHSDRRGNARHNLQLSQQRLQAVEATLRELGLGSVVVETTAAGASRPLARTDTDESAFFDRRVELRVRSYGTPLLSSK